MQMNRLFEIVYLLINRKRMTAKELSEHFEVSQRTIYRDIDLLCQSGIPLYTNKGKGGGICLMENFVLNKSLLSDREQTDILAALQGLKVTNAPEVDQVLQKLNRMFGNVNSDWIEVDFSYWNSTELDRQNFMTLKEAILKRKLIQFDYYNSKGEETHRIVEPRKLIFKGQAWYLSGYCRDRKDDRFFKLSRIKNLQMNEEIFVPSAELKLTGEEPFASPVDKVNLILKIDQEMAYRVYDEFPREAISTDENGDFLIHGSMQYSSWLYGYLMSYENHLEVLEPASIRDELIYKIKNILERYKI